LINDVRQSEQMRDCGPFIEDTFFDKEAHFGDIYFPDLFDNFEESRDYGQDGAFDERICDQMWEGTHDIYWVAKTGRC
jgi:hypothetical protein